MYLVYIIVSDNLSYIGMTNNFFKRWQQHNSYLKGGARYTSKKSNWTPICIIDGFKTKSEAMQCEWRLKRARGQKNRIKYLSHLLKNEKKWTSKSPLIKNQSLVIYVVEKYNYLFSHYKELVWFN